MKKLQQKHLYGNCIMLSPEGQTLCLCDQKKINWYLSRNLAILESEDPPTIRLNFTPKGNGKADHPYYITEKKNICVCCGTDCWGGFRQVGLTAFFLRVLRLARSLLAGVVSGKAKCHNRVEDAITHLTKHHCVPRCFRKHFPKEYKRHNCHDIVLLCDACHIKYEAFANELKLKLIDENNIAKYVRTEKDEALRRAASYANALVRYEDRIPLPRKQELERRIKDYLQRDFIFDDLKELCKNDRHLNRLASESDRFGAKVVEKLISIPDFIVMWRKHFVSKMNPKFLPEFWSVSHDDLEN